MPSSSRRLTVPKRRSDLARRRLDLELVHRKLVSSRAAAQRAIADGRVTVAGMVDPKAATLVDRSIDVRVADDEPSFVSRAGKKLEAALARFDIAVSGRSAIDAGASTGGFTDCLLRRGATAVTAVDVGYGQLDWSLRTDDRVIAMERTNIRTATADELGAPFDVVVADLSFIGLKLVAEQLVALGHSGTDWILLVKPQFEAGREAVGSGGVVRDPEARVEAVVTVADTFAALGVGTAGCVASPVTGAKGGNQEFLLWLRRDAPPPQMIELAEVVRRA